MVAQRYTRKQILGVLGEMEKHLVSCLDAMGECDHAVNICVCGERALLEDVKEVIKNVEEVAVAVAFVDPNTGMREEVLLTPEDVKAAQRVHGSLSFFIKGCIEIGMESVYDQIRCEEENEGGNLPQPEDRE